jgi:hypothetical protein
MAEVSLMSAAEKRHSFITSCLERVVKYVNAADPMGAPWYIETEAITGLNKPLDGDVMRAIENMLRTAGYSASEVEAIPKASSGAGGLKIRHELRIDYVPLKSVDEQK